MSGRAVAPTRRTASSTPGMNELRSIESWRIVSVWPSPPKIDLLVGDEARQADRVDRLVDVAAGLGDQLGGPLRGARRRVELAVVVKLDDLDLGHVLGGLGGEAHHQHRADREVGGDEARWRLRRRSAAVAQRVEVEAGGADDDVDAGVEAGVGRSSSAVSGVVKSTTTSASARTSASSRPERGIGAPGELHVVGALDRLADGLPMRPAAPETTDPDHSCAGPRETLRRRRVAEAVLVRADAGGGELAGVVELGRQRGDLVGGDRVDPGEHLVEREQRDVEQRRAGEARHPRGGRLEPEDHAALDVLLGARQLVVADALGARAWRARGR